MLVQFITNGIITGGIYAIIALGFAIIYNTTKIFHIAYGVIYMIAPFFVFLFNKLLSFPISISITLSICLTIIVSIIIEILVYKPLVKRKSSLNIIMISSIGVMIILINIIALLFGSDTKIINSEFAKTIKLGEIIVTYPQIIQLSVCIILIVFFLVFLKYSKFGIKTRALRDNPELSEMFGFNVFRFRIRLFALSGFFAAVGGILVGYDVGMNPYIGMPMLLNAIVALIIGGIGKFHTPIIGGFVIGILQALVVWQFSASWQEAVTFTILIIFLLFRPQGLFGEKIRLV